LVSNNKVEKLLTGGGCFKYIHRRVGNYKNLYEEGAEIANSQSVEKRKSRRPNNENYSENYSVDKTSTEPSSPLKYTRIA